MSKFDFLSSTFYNLGRVAFIDKPYPLLKQMGESVYMFTMPGFNSIDEFHDDQPMTKIRFDLSNSIHLLPKDYRDLIYSLWVYTSKLAVSKYGIPTSSIAVFHNQNELSWHSHSKVKTVKTFTVCYRLGDNTPNAILDIGDASHAYPNKKMFCCTFDSSKEHRVRQFDNNLYMYFVFDYKRDTNDIEEFSFESLDHDIGKIHDMIRLT